MERDFKIRKRLILGGLTLLLGADLVLMAYSWRQSATPRTPKQQLTAELQQLDLLRADIRRAEEIKEKMPSTQKDCDKFEQSLRPADAGYSAVLAELGAIAAKSSLHLDGTTFKQKAIPNRNLEVVDVEAAVDGDYAGVVRFVNGLQRSDSVYEVDAITLAGDTQSRSGSAPVRVLVHMRTYFRTV
jgi:Tfp pilus assembly protein PilO